jgi:hypothetical protein
VIGSLVEIIGRRTCRPYAIRLALMGVYALVMVAAYGWFEPRTTQFAQQPTVPFQLVKEHYADKFDWYGDVLDLETASVLLPDVGGMLYYSRHRVYDLAGLTDRRVAETLGRQINRAGFYAYVFEEIQPSFIHMHGHWTMLARLDNDPRFREQYMPLCEYVDPWVQQVYRVERYSGDYVRREIAEAQPEAMGEIRRQLDETCVLVE